MLEDQENVNQDVGLNAFVLLGPMNRRKTSK